MKLNYDKTMIEGEYDERNLTLCKCGKHRYPSKKMFIEFLNQYKDIKGDVDLWSTRDLDTGEVKIHLELSYKISNDKTTCRK